MHKSKCVSWSSPHWAIFTNFIFVGSSSWVHRNFNQLVTLGCSLAVLSLHIQWSQGAVCFWAYFCCLLLLYFKSNNKRKTTSYEISSSRQGLKSMLQRRQTLQMFYMAEEDFILNTTLALCLPVAPVQDYICCKHSASVFCPKLHIRVKINGNSQVGWESRSIWQPNWKTNPEGI